VSLAPGEIRLFTDIVASLFLAPESRGAVLIEQCIWPPAPPDPFFAVSRTYTETAAAGRGTNGTAVPSFSPEQATRIAVFIGLASNAGDFGGGHRSNCGIVHWNANPVAVRITLRDSSGATLASGSFSVSDPLQLNDVFAALGVPGLVTTNASLTVESEAPVFPYVTVIDNQSGDSIFLPFSSFALPFR
jgi:hypothetical protein